MGMESIIVPGQRLGRKAIKTDSRTLKMAKYMADMTQFVLPNKDWTGPVKQWGMMLNDQLGDCTIAGLGHAIQVWTANSGDEVTLSDQQILTGYETFDGYNPNDPNTDQGGIELDVLTAFQKQGFAGHVLDVFTKANVANLNEIRASVVLFGGIYIGVELPLSAQNQDVWDVVPDPGDGSSEPGSWGGHCVFVPKYDQNGFTCVTWGALKPMTIAFWRKYVDEAYPLLSADWIVDNPPAGRFDLLTLQKDLSEIS